MAWRVVQSGELRSRLEATLSGLTQRLENANDAEPDEVSAAIREYDEFAAFVSELSAISDGHVDASRHLRLSGLQAEYCGIALLTVGSWQATFLVNHSDRVCTITEISRVSPAIEKAKNLLRRRLSP